MNLDARGRMFTTAEETIPDSTPKGGQSKVMFWLIMAVIVTGSQQKHDVKKLHKHLVCWIPISSLQFNLVIHVILHSAITSRKLMVLAVKD